MTTTNALPFVCVLVLAFAVAPQGIAETSSDEKEVEFSVAETTLWMTDQLSAVQKPMSMTYEFERSGTLEPGFNDTVVFIVDDLHEDGMKSAHLEFFTGERQFNVPPAERTNVNPVIKVYLQGDVYEMNRLTDPDGTSKERWRYFQRRIKFALADGAEVKSTSIKFEGKEYAAKEIYFTPFVNDPHRQKFDRFADKTYSFVVSDDLPGYLYSIETIIPGDNENAPPLVREKLTLSALSYQ